MTRNPYFDNAKAILIILVVLGHIMSEMFTTNRWISSIYMFIYLFHMPAFILVSGFFSRRIQKINEVWKFVKRLIIPYLLFQIVYTLYYQKVFEDNIEFSILTPRWALWFLISMFCWNLMLVIFGKNKIGLLISIVLSLGVGYIGEINETFTLSRTFFFFPFFLLGYFLESKHFEWLKQRKNVMASWVSFGLVFVCMFLYGDIEWREWIYGRIGYEEIMDGSITYGFLYRLSVYIVMAVVTYCFLSIVPKKEMVITKIGSATLIVYLFHMFIIKFIHESYLYEWIEKSQHYFVLFVIPFVIVYILTRKPVLLIGSKFLGVKFNN